MPPQITAGHVARLKTPVQAVAALTLETLAPAVTSFVLGGLPAAVAPPPALTNPRR